MYHENVNRIPQIAGNRGNSLLPLQVQEGTAPMPSTGPYYLHILESWTPNKTWNSPCEVTTAYV